MISCCRFTSSSGLAFSRRPLRRSHNRFQIVLLKFHQELHSHFHQTFQDELILNLRRSKLRALSKLSTNYATNHQKHKGHHAEKRNYGTCHALILRETLLSFSYICRKFKVNMNLSFKERNILPNFTCNVFGFSGGFFLLNSSSTPLFMCNS